MPEDTKDAPKAARLLRAPNFKNAYSNTFRIRIGDNDISIAFGYQTEVLDQVILQDEVEVVLTPRTFKVLALAIGPILEDIEKQMGTIAVPQEIIDGVNASLKETRDAAAKQAEQSK
jgi:hypothetical protein